jgi:Xaa-Pro aminopeptidase
MFQSFSSPADSAETSARVKGVREQLGKAKLDAFLIPRADEHQGEYVPPCAERLKWLTGFSGSAGLAVVARKHAAVFVDGRYTVQVAAECDAKVFSFPGIARLKLTEWLIAHLPARSVVGFDPWLHTAGEITRLTAALKPKSILLKPVPINLVDAVWGCDRPDPPQGPVVLHPLKLSGRTADKKIADVQKKLSDDGQLAAVLTLPDSIAWLFNIRGSDIAHNPVSLAFAIVPASGKPELFIDPAKLSKDMRKELDPVVRISAPGKLKDKLAALKRTGKRVRLDTETAAFSLSKALGSSSVAPGADPCIALKAIKNAAEIEGARRAHVRDGAAIVRYLAWLDDAAAGGMLDEISAVTKLEDVRAQTQQLKDISFDTISGSGPNGAIVHYRVTDKTNRKLQPGELFLLDSGAQYEDGTTDITRTIAIGEPSSEMRERFTLVLKGHIAIATARFPKGTRGIDLDPFARRALWQHGLDYDHGTGHGVGSYLSVHEGPQSISRAGVVALEPGMICSNEPGYYKQGHYGIRLENLVLITEPVIPDGGDRPVMAFETLTLVPFDRRLVVSEILTREERDWLNAYHARVCDEIGPEVDVRARAWLDAATAEV